MKLTTKTLNPLRLKSDLLIICCHEGKQIKGSYIDAVDSKLKGALKKVLKREEFCGKRGESKHLYTHGAIPAQDLLVVGLGDKKKLDVEALRECGALVQGFASKIKAKNIVFALDYDKDLSTGLVAYTQAFAEGFLLSTYKFSRYIKPTKQILKECVITCKEKQRTKVAKALQQATILRDGTFLARDLVNTPGGDLTPAQLVKEARKLKGVRTRVHALPAIKKMKMGAFLSVALGSTKTPPYFIEMHYTPTSKAKKHIAIVGKGVTFDTGGYSLKPPKSMETMKCDMGGAATVIGLMSIISKLKPKVSVSCYIAATENMIDGTAQRPGDVCRAMNGKTIEVLNTDAEGRLTLADALHYANKKKPDYMIDIATLTGACVVALGCRYTGGMSNNKDLLDKLIASGEVQNEKIWPLPLAEEYREELKSPIADLKNIAGPYAGTITAGLFLESFVGKTKWAHLDIAGTAWFDKPMAYVPRGGTGVMVRTLAHFLSTF
ncbi:leucyl aminopeptidase [bacterium]|nr:leucyl aminopeptidase [bacterium]MBU1918385.1 leucyl aminopeptidase [bacterium]